MAGFALTSPAFGAGAMIPARYTGDGPDVSPPLEWTASPAGTKSLVLIVDDPDAPVGTWVHWVLVGIPPDHRKLPEGVEKAAKPGSLAGAVNGKNDVGRLGYGGHGPPRGAARRYFFERYAVDTALALSS